VALPAVVERRDVADGLLVLLGDFASREVARAEVDGLALGEVFEGDRSGGGAGAVGAGVDADLVGPVAGDVLRERELRASR
jgi:hypothetical protein